MLLGVAATFATTSPPPDAAGRTTARLPAGHSLTLFGPSATSFQFRVWPSLVRNGVLLVRDRYFLKMWLVPDWSRRTTRVIWVPVTQPAPVIASPLLLPASAVSTSAHVLIVPR